MRSPGPRKTKVMYSLSHVDLNIDFFFRFQCFKVKFLLEASKLERGLEVGVKEG